jgi:hypothetical protein
LSDEGWLIVGCEFGKSKIYASELFYFHVLLYFPLKGFSHLLFFLFGPPPGNVVYVITMLSVSASIGIDFSYREFYMSSLYSFFRLQYYEYTFNKFDKVASRKPSKHYPLPFIAQDAS